MQATHKLRIDVKGVDLLNVYNFILNPYRKTFTQPICPILYLRFTITPIKHLCDIFFKTATNVSTKSILSFCLGY